MTSWVLANAWNVGFVVNILEIIILFKKAKGLTVQIEIRLFELLKINLKKEKEICHHYLIPWTVWIKKNAT